MRELHRAGRLAILGLLGLSCTRVETPPEAALPSPPRRAPSPAAPVAPVAAPRPVAPLASGPAASPEGAPPAARLVVQLDPCLRAGCPLVFRFNLPMLREAPRAGSAPVEVQLRPRQAGRFAWRSTTELVFSPDAGALLHGHALDVVIARATPLAGARFALAAPFRASVQVPAFEAAGKVASWPVRPGHPRFVAFLDHHREEIGRGPILLLYDQPVDPTWVGRRLRARRADGARLPVAVSRPASAGEVWDGPLDLRHVVALRVLRLPPDGEKLSVEVPGRGGGTQRAETRELTVRKSLALARLWYPGSQRARRGVPVLPLAGTVSFELSNPVAAKRIEGALAIRPRPRQVGVAVYGSTVQVSLALEPGRSYALELPAGVQDILGNPLGRALRARFLAQDLAPSLELPGPAVLLEGGRARLPLRALNLGEVRAELRAFPTIEAFARAVVLGGRRRCAEHAGLRPAQSLRALPQGPTLNQPTSLQLPLGDPPALACVEVSAPGRGSEARGLERAAALIQTTRVGVTAKLHGRGLLAWAVRLDSGAPLAGARVRVLDRQGKTVASATTERDGVATLGPSPGLSARADLAGRGAVLVVEAGHELGLLELREDRLSQPWQFGQPAEVKGVAPLAASVFSDRGVYRPGETVHVKVLTATELDTPAGKLQVTVRDPRGKPLLTRTLPLDAGLGASFDLPLSRAAPVGRYSLRLTRGEASLERSFRVEEYRVPHFEVKVEPEAAPWQVGQSATALIRARYLHGGHLAGRALRYVLSRTPEPFAPTGFPQWVFGRAATARPETAILLEGQGRLDGRSGFVLSFRPEQAALEGPMRYLLEASVEDVDRQVYAGRASRVVHGAAFYLGLRPPPRSILRPRDLLEVPLAAVTPDGSTRAGVAVTVSLERVEFHTTARAHRGPRDAGVQLLNRAVAAVASVCRVRTAERPVSCRLRVPGAGRYRVTASADDPRGRRVEAGFEVTAPGAGAIAWPRFDHERIELVTDRSEYRPGETARLMIQSPFRRARGLLTLERSGVIERRLFELRDDAPALAILLREAHAPNLYASVVLVRPRVHDQKDASGFETGAPAFRMGYAKLVVRPADRALSVRIAPSRAVAAPGEELALDLAVRLPAGRPAPGTVAVAVVDEAVLGLTGYRTPRPLEELHPERPLGVRTASSLLELPHARRARHEAIFPSGGDDGDDLAEARRKREPPFLLRKLFRSTAYWNPAVVLGADGRARLRVSLPDNLTTFRVMAVAADAAGRAGAAEARVVVRRPLQVRAVLPRFVYPGDRLALEAQVTNGTEARQRVTVRASLDGAELAGPAERSLDLEPGATSNLPFPIRVVAPRARAREAAVIGERPAGELTVRFAATLAGARLRDAVENRVPVLSPGTRRTLVSSHSVSGEQRLSLSLPADRVPGSARLELLASSTGLTELKGAVQYLMEYPNGCLEQTTSTAYPLVMLKELLPEIGVSVDQTTLRKLSEAGVKRLLSFQTPQGGLAYWPGGNRPHAFGTAFALSALHEAKVRGYQVPDDSLRRMADYLEATLRQGAIQEEMPHGGMADADTRAYLVMTLGRLGRAQPAAIATLWQNRAKLTAFGLSFLAVALSEAKSGDRSLLPTLLAEVRARAKVEREEAYYTGSSPTGASMGSPLRTHAGALLAYASSAPQDALAGKLFAGLLRRRSGGLWGNTQENVFGVMAIARLAASKAAQGAAPSFELYLEGQRLGERRFERAGRSYRLALVEGESLLRLGEGRRERRAVRVVNRGTGPLQLSARVSWEATLSERNRAARARGFLLERRYETPDGRALDPAAIPLGALVRVRLQLRTEARRSYVALEDRLPAGLEPLNQSLATTERVKLAPPSEALTRTLPLISHGETRDARVAFYLDELPAGSYELAYLARATTPGSFLRPAASVEAMYAPTVAASTAIDQVTVR